MTLPRISPSDAKLLIDGGALLVDIREEEEFVREHIPGAMNHPLAGLRAGTVSTTAAAVVFHCKSGNRTRLNANILARAVDNVDGFIIDGGIEAWKAAGLPVVKDSHQPIELTRQVQVAAGGATLLSTLLGYFLNPGFYAVAGIVGAALLLTGLTGSSVFNKLMSAMPWNHRAHAS
jgi:rhodanese-related sulfurtransferase